jgi:cytochrome c oxidase assembly factor CtaG
VGGVRVRGAVVGLGGGAAVGGLLVLLDAGAYARLGVPAPGVAAQVCVAGLRAVAELAAGFAVGTLVFAAFVVAPQRSGVLDVGGWLAVRRAAAAATVAGVAALLLGPLTAADLSGVALGEVLDPRRLHLYATLEEPMAWLITAAGLLTCAAGCALVLRWRWVPPLVAVGAASLLPIVVVGPAVTGAGHDWTTDASVLQAVGGVVLGVLAALLAPPAGALDRCAERRCRRIAMALAAAQLGSAVVLAVLRVGTGPVLATPYGAVAVVRILVLALVVVAVLLLPRRGAAGGALVGAGLAVVFGAVLARWVPPRFLERSDTPGETLIGYDLPDPVTATRLLLDWRFNILFGSAALLLAAGYLLAVLRLARRGDGWPRGRTVAWLAGCAVLLVATSSGLGRYSPGVFSVHMVSHMALTMLAPVLLAVGGPVTLALRALPAAGRAGPQGPREWLAALVGSRAAGRVAHPLVALVLFVGSFYALYLTGLFDAALRYHWAHQLMNLHFLLVGYLFFWPVVGSDPAPVRLPHLGRLALLLAAMPFHAFFGIVVMSAERVLGGDFYRSLALPWVPDLLGDQRLGGGIAWASGELPMLLVVIVLLTRWARDDAREAARHDRRAAADGDAELAAYNAMLARLAGADR